MVTSLCVRLYPLLMCLQDAYAYATIRILHSHFIPGQERRLSASVTWHEVIGSDCGGRMPRLNLGKATSEWNRKYPVVWMSSAYPHNVAFLPADVRQAKNCTTRLAVFAYTGGPADPS
jgi:hypothetical protein